MPTAWSAGPHDVKNFSEGQPDGTIRHFLRCKCGWEREMILEEIENLDMQWRMWAAEHYADDPDPYGYGGTMGDLVNQVLAERRRAGNRPDA